MAEKAKVHSIETDEISAAVLPSGHKTWTAPLIEHNLLDYVHQLHRRGALKVKFPEVFSELRSFRPVATDPDTVLLISPTKEVSVIARQDLEHRMLIHFFKKLTITRYAGHALSVRNQVNLIERVLHYLDRFKVEDLQIFSFASEDQYCWRKLSWDLMPPRYFKLDSGYDISKTHITAAELPRFLPAAINEQLSFHAPAFQMLLERCTNKIALMAWLGSLMDRAKGNHQFLYLLGRGRDGKGTLIRALQIIFGERLMFTQNIPDEKSGALRFFSANLEGKLLLASPEYPDTELFGSFLKGITGGDALTIEPKGKQARNAVNHLKVIIASNHRPKIPDTPAARGRIIMATFESVPDSDIRLNFEEALIPEAPEFFSLCYYVFKSMRSPAKITQDESVYTKNFEELNESALTRIQNAFYIYDLPETKFDATTAPKRELPHMLVGEFGLYVTKMLRNVSAEEVKRLLIQKSKVGYVKKLAFCKKNKSWAVMGISPKFKESLADLVPNDSFNSCSLLTPPEDEELEPQDIPDLP